MSKISSRNKQKEAPAGQVSFSFHVREEMARTMPERRCCREAMLAAFIFCEGGQEYPKGPLAVETGFSPVARLVYRLVKDVARTPVSWETQREAFFNRRQIFQIRLPENEAVDEFAGKWGIGGMVDRKNIRRACCRRAFLAGAFMASGSVNSPNRYYHFEIVQKNSDTAKLLVQILARMEIEGKISKRKNSYLVYVKKADEIGNLLNILGAYNSLLQFEEVRAIKETKEEVRRRVNAETANLDKTACAAARQVFSIRYLQRAGLLENLPESLVTTAQMRIRFPQASLKELGERLSPPLTKSSVNSRLRRLEDIFRRIKSE